MITTVREFIASVKMMRTAQKLYEKTPTQCLKKHTVALEKEVDNAIETALKDKKQINRKNQ